MPPNNLVLAGLNLYNKDVHSYNSCMDLYTNKVDLFRFSTVPDAFSRVRIQFDLVQFVCRFATTLECVLNCFDAYSILQSERGNSLD